MYTTNLIYTFYILQNLAHAFCDAAYYAAVHKNTGMEALKCSYLPNKNHYHYLTLHHC